MGAQFEAADYAATGSARCGPRHSYYENTWGAKPSQLSEQEGSMLALRALDTAAESDTARRAWIAAERFLSRDQDCVREGITFAREQNRRRVQRNGCMIEEPYVGSKPSPTGASTSKAARPGDPSGHWVPEAFCLSRLVRRVKTFLGLRSNRNGSDWHPGTLTVEWPRLKCTQKASPLSCGCFITTVVHYRSAPLKSAFEQSTGRVSGADAFSEWVARPEDDCFWRVEYDGEIASNGARTHERDKFRRAHARAIVELMDSVLQKRAKTTQLKRQ